MSYGTIERHLTRSEYDEMLEYFYVNVGESDSKFVLSSGTTILYRMYTHATKHSIHIVINSVHAYLLRVQSYAYELSHYDTEYKAKLSSDNARRLLESKYKVSYEDTKPLHGLTDEQIKERFDNKLCSDENFIDHMVFYMNIYIRRADFGKYRWIDKHTPLKWTNGDNLIPEQTIDYNCTVNIRKAIRRLIDIGCELK